MNKLRADRARAAIAAYLDAKVELPDTMKTDITDLVTDLLHLAQYKKVDYLDVLLNAENHFIAERED